MLHDPNFQKRSRAPFDRGRFVFYCLQRKREWWEVEVKWREGKV